MEEVKEETVSEPTHSEKIIVSDEITTICTEEICRVEKAEVTEETKKKKRSKRNRNK